jgi:hypothetical protein
MSAGNWATIVVQEAFLTDLVDDPPHDEATMCDLLASVYESSELSIFHEQVEVVAYARRPGRPMNEPDSLIYEIRYRAVRK